MLKIHMYGNFVFRYYDNSSYFRVSVYTSACRCSSCNLLYEKKKVRITLFCHRVCQGGHGIGKTGNLAVNFSRQGSTGNLVNLIFYTGKIVTTQGKF